MPAAYYDLYGEEGSFFVLKLNLLDKDGKPVNLSDFSKGFYVPEELQALGIQSSQISSISARLQIKSNIFNQDSINLFKSGNPSTSEGSIVLKDSFNNKTLDHNILIYKKLERTTLILGQLEGIELITPGIGLSTSSGRVLDSKGTTYTITTSRLANPDTEATYFSADLPYPRTRLFSAQGVGVCDSTVSNVTINRVNTKSSYSVGEELELNVAPFAFPCAFYGYGASEGIDSEDPIETENLIYYLSVTSIHDAGTHQIPNVGDVINLTGTIDGLNRTLKFVIANRYCGTGTLFQPCQTTAGRWDAVFSLWYGGDDTTDNYLSYSKLQAFFNTVSRTDNISFTRQEFNVTTGRPKGPVLPSAATGQIVALGGANRIYCGNKSEWENPLDASVFNTVGQWPLTKNNFQLDPRVIRDIGGNPAVGPGGSAERRLYFLSCSKQDKFLNQWDGWADQFSTCGCLMKIYTDSQQITNMETRTFNEGSIVPSAIYDLKAGASGGLTPGKIMNGVTVQDGRNLMRYTKPVLRVTEVSQKDVSILGTHFYDLELDFTVTGSNAETYTIRMMQGKFTISPEVSY